MTKDWIKENWVYFTPFVSWCNRPYHWIKKDEDVWTEIDRNLMCATGNVLLIIFLFLVYGLILANQG